MLERFSKIIIGVYIGDTFWGKPGIGPCILDSWCLYLTRLDA